MPQQGVSGYDPVVNIFKAWMARLRLSCHKLELAAIISHTPNPRMREYADNVLLARVKDEAHFLFSCEKYDTIRTRLDSDLQDINVTFSVHDPNALKIFDCDDIRVILCLGRYISQCLLLRVVKSHEQANTYYCLFA